MNRIFLVMFFLSMRISAQDFGDEAPTAFIAKNDGTIIESRSIFVDQIDKEVVYSDENNIRRIIKFKEITEANIGSSIFRVFEGGKRGYFIRTESDTKMLAVNYKMHTMKNFLVAADIYILDTSGNVLEELHVTDKEKDIPKRQQIREMLKRNFADCPNFLKIFGSFEDDKDPKLFQVWNFFSFARYTNCD